MKEKDPRTSLFNLLKKIFIKCYSFLLIQLILFGLVGFLFNSDWEIHWKLLISFLGFILGAGMGLSMLVEQFPILIGFSFYSLIYFINSLSLYLQWNWLLTGHWFFYCIAQYLIFFGLSHLISLNFNNFFIVIEGGNSLIDLFNFTGQKISAPDLEDS